MKSAQSKTGEAGTTKTGKSHEADIARGEGIAIGSVDKAHEKHKVATTAKENVSAQAKAHAAHERRENGGANPEGEDKDFTGVQYGKGSTKPLEDKGAKAAAQAAYERAEASNPDSRTGE